MINDFYKNAGKKRKHNELIESKIYEIDKIIKNNLSKGIKLGDIEIEDFKKQEFANLVFYIISKGKFYLKLYVDLVKYYLNKFTKYSNFDGDKDYFLKKLSMSMNPEKFPKNRIIFRKDDIGDKFYIILRGSVSIIIVKETYVNLTPKEYDMYLENLILYKEYHLIKQVFTYPNKIESNISVLETIHKDILAHPEIINSINNNDINISASEFVDRIEPVINYDSLEERVKVRIASYKIVATLKEGDTFGEIALNKNDREEKRRTATVITDTECLIGTIFNNVYSSFLREVEEKNKLVLIGHVLQHTLFRNVSPENFLKYNYFNYFNSRIYKGGDFLFHQGETRNSIFFVDEGLINLYTESSFEDINNYILYFKKDINKYNKIYNKIINKKEIDEDFYINKKYQLQREINPLFDKYYTTNRKIKIYNINKKETLGYEDCLLDEDKYFMSARVISQHCQVFILEINFLPSILKDYLISKNFGITNLERKEIMIQRLRNIKITFLDKFLQNNKITHSVLESVKPKKKKKGSSNHFHASNTIINLRQSFNKNECKNSEINEKSIFSLKIKKKHNNSKKYSIFSTLTFNRKNIDNETIILDKKLKNNNFLIQSEEEMEKYKDKINKNKNTVLNLKNNFRNKSEKKTESLLLPKLYKIKTINKNKSKKDDKKCITDKDIKSENKINNLIPKMSFLSKKLMINEDDNNQKNKKVKNMTQLDFLFYDYLFTERGNKNYSKEPMDLNE